MIQAAVERAVDAGKLIFSAAASVAVGWLVAAVALHLISQVVRMRAWWHILRAAYPDCRTLRARDATSAYLAGAGLNGLLPARAGDLVKLAVLHKRIRGSRYATLAATSVPETVFETFCGAVLVTWALTQGFLPIPVVPGEIPAPDVSWYLTHPATAWLVTVIAVWTIVLLAESLRRRCRTVARRVGQGLAIFRSPRAYALHVASWQALGRVIRLASLACFLAAFALPVSPGTALLVMAAQGGGRIIPIAPVSAGLRIAMLSYGLVELSGQPVDPAAITAFTFGASAVLFIVMLAISLVLIGHELQTRSPRLALQQARRRLLRNAPGRATAVPARDALRPKSRPRRLAHAVRIPRRVAPAGSAPGAPSSCRAPPAARTQETCASAAARGSARARRPRRPRARSRLRGVDDGTRCGKPESGSFVAARPVSSVERLEDAGTVLARDPRPGVGDLDLDAVGHPFGALCGCSRARRPCAASHPGRLERLDSNATTSDAPPTQSAL